MNKTQIMDKLLKDNKGYLFTSEVEDNDISRTYLGIYVKNKGLKQINKGIYVKDGLKIDDFYVLSRRYTNFIFSGVSALYLNNLIDYPEYLEITVPPNYGRTNLVRENVKVHQEKLDTFTLGKSNIKTPLGHKVVAYDKERCILELSKDKNKFESEIISSILKKYNDSEDKDIKKLKRYAKNLHIKDEVINYVLTFGENK